MKVVTSFLYPPIPVRHFDWAAYIEGDEDGTGSGTTGRGETEVDALRDLAEKLAETLEHRTSCAYR
jgi:hypothetical protein